jgi:hypothetical protein
MSADATAAAAASAAAAAAALRCISGVIQTKSAVAKSTDSTGTCASSRICRILQHMP